MEATNLKNGKRVPVMHGENWFMPIDTMPAGETKKLKSYIAGHSETGHHHVLESKTEFEVLEPLSGDRVVLLNDVARLFHQKTYDRHEDQVLAPGAYAIYHKTEYDPFAQVVRQVWD